MPRDACLLVNITIFHKEVRVLSIGSIQCVADVHCCISKHCMHAHMHADYDVIRKSLLQ